MLLHPHVFSLLNVAGVFCARQGCLRSLLTCSVKSNSLSHRKFLRDCGADAKEVVICVIDCILIFDLMLEVPRHFSQTAAREVGQPRQDHEVYVTCVRRIRCHRLELRFVPLKRSSSSRPFAWGRKQSSMIANFMPCRYWTVA